VRYFTCDGCQPIDAKVTFLAAREEFTQPVIFSRDNREKLVFKAEARLPQGLDLHPASRSKSGLYKVVP